MRIIEFANIKAIHKLPCPYALTEYSWISSYYKREKLELLINKHFQLLYDIPF